MPGKVPTFVSCGEPDRLNPDVLSLGEGAISLRFPNGGTRGIVFADSMAAHDAFHDLYDWMAAHVRQASKTKEERRQ